MTTKSSIQLFHFESAVDIHYICADMDILYGIPDGSTYYKYVGDDEWLCDLSDDDALILFLLVCESENIGE